MSGDPTESRPMVFISHASEDKERFVEGFARKLMGKGIQVWYDKWEMFTGDSLIDKIFEEGLKGADAVIIVLSNNSVQKPWVIEELNAAMVKKINSKTKLIPLLIDNCSVPECLRSTLWQKIEDTDDYESEFERIVASIFRITEKPPLAEPPKYSRAKISNIPGLTKQDTLIFQLLCQQAIENNRLRGDIRSASEKVHDYDINREQLSDSLEMLESKAFVKLTRGDNVGLILYHITPYGFHQYCQANIPDYDSMNKAVIFQLVNNSPRDNNTIIKATGLDGLFVDNILKVLRDYGDIQITTFSGGIFINKVSVKLKREAETF